MKKEASKTSSKHEILRFYIAKGYKDIYDLILGAYVHQITM